jgi:Xaa-Pro aminopeptidase
MDKNIYINRRKLISSKLEKNSIAVIPSGTKKSRNMNNSYSFRQDSYFYYLTGFQEPNAMLIIQSSGETILFCQEKNKHLETWDGPLLGIDAAPDVLGVTQAKSINSVDKEIVLLLENHKSIYYPFAIYPGFATRVSGWINDFQNNFKNLTVHNQYNLCVILNEMRLIKDSGELSNIRIANSISADAHIEAMKLSSSTFRSGSDLFDYHLEAELLYNFRKRGATGPAYNSIIAGGIDACTLHHLPNSSKINPADLILIDAGCEYNCYASDITRTFPANGKFIGPKKDLYSLVLLAQKAAIKEAKPGNKFIDPHNAAINILSQGLLDLGILDKNIHGTAADVIANKNYLQFYMHNTSHWLGLDVHDVGNYITEQESRILIPGMVFTIEPGLYISNNLDLFNNTGIRIEDTIAITETGCEIFSAGVPKEITEIEHLMKF